MQLCLGWGHRAVLAGFVIRGSDALSSSDHCALTNLGLDTPELSTGDGSSSLASLERPRFVVPAVPVVFELFPGSGHVTACLRKLGLHAAHGIDHVVVPEAASSPLIAGWTTEEDQQLAFVLDNQPATLRSVCSPRLVAHFVGPRSPVLARSRSATCYLCQPHLRLLGPHCSLVPQPHRSWFWNTSFF